MKGHCQILLQDATKSTVKKIDADNLVTNAFKYRLNYNILMRYGYDAIAESLLGAVMLFDGPLTESATSVHFPAEAHLVGYGDAGTDTTDAMRGTYNALESGPTSQGYTLVWDFSTSQCNGTIGAIALTGRDGVQSQNGLTSGFAAYSGSEQDKYFYSGYYHDGEYAYGFKYKSHDAGHYTYTLRRWPAPCGNIKVSTNSRLGPEDESTWEVVKDITLDSYQRSWTYSEPDQCLVSAWLESSSSGGVYANVLKFDKVYVSDWSYPGQVSITLDGITSHELSFFCWAGSYAYAKHNLTLYRVNPANAADVQTITFDAKYTDIQIANALPCGVVSVWLYDSEYVASDSRNKWRWAFIYPDKQIVYGKYWSSTSGGERLKDYRCEAYSETLYRLRNGYWYGYLGTICNLSSPVTKTAATTMKVIYTLTDV